MAMMLWSEMSRMKTKARFRLPLDCFAEPNLTCSSNSQSLMRDLVVASLRKSFTQVLAMA